MTETKSIKFNGLSFNCNWAATKTEDEFVEYWQARAFYNVKPNEREQLLREAYKLCCKTVGVEPKPSLLNQVKAASKTENYPVLEENKVIPEEKPKQENKKGGK